MHFMPNYPDSTACEHCRPVPFSCELYAESSVYTTMWRILRLVDKLLISRRVVSLLSQNSCHVFYTNGLCIDHPSLTNTQKLKLRKEINS